MADYPEKIKEFLGIKNLQVFVNQERKVNKLNFGCDKKKNTVQNFNRNLIHASYKCDNITIAPLFTVVGVSDSLENMIWIIS